MIQKHEHAAIVKESIYGFLEMLKQHNAVISAAMRQIPYAEDARHVEALALLIEEETDRAKYTGVCMRKEVEGVIEGAIKAIEDEGLND